MINQRFLNDMVIHYFQKLVKNGNGLQDPLLGQKIKFKVCSEEFTQLLHDGKHHWVTISTLDCQPGEFKYYDSMFKGKLTESVKNQICCIIRFKGEISKLTLCLFNNNKMGLIVAFMPSHLWYPLSARKILQAYLLMTRGCEIIYMIARKQEGLCHFQVQRKM